MPFVKFLTMFSNVISLDLNVLDTTLVRKQASGDVIKT